MLRQSHVSYFDTRIIFWRSLFGWSKQLKLPTSSVRSAVCSSVYVLYDTDPLGMNPNNDQVVSPRNQFWHRYILKRSFSRIRSPSSTSLKVAPTSLVSPLNFPWRWGLNINNRPGRRGFKFILSFSAFTKLHCNANDSMWEIKSA